MSILGIVFVALSFMIVTTNGNKSMQKEHIAKQEEIQKIPDTLPKYISPEGLTNTGK